MGTHKQRWSAIAPVLPKCGIQLLALRDESKVGLAYVGYNGEDCFDMCS